MNHLYECRYHIVWCPKYGRKVLTEEIKQRLITILQSRQEELKYIIEQIDIELNYVHLLISADSETSIPDLIKTLKNSSARILRAEFPILKSRLPNMWTKNTLMTTIGSEALEKLQQYVNSQRGL